MFGIILTSIITVFHVYVLWRAWSMPLIKSRVPSTVYAAAGVLLWAVFVSGRLLGHGQTGILAQSLEFAGMTWMAILFLCTVCLLITEFLTCFGLVFPRKAPAMRGVALILGGLLSVIALVQGVRPPVITHYDVNLCGLPRALEGTVIVAISDLHLGSQLGGKWLENRIAQVHKEHPDLVLLLGDIFEGHGVFPEDLFSALDNLHAPLGVFAVPGNHEFHGSDNTGLKMIEAAGFQLLLNRWVEVRPGLVISGIEDLTTNHRRGLSRDPLSTALAHRPDGATILLSHTPWQVERAADKGVGLMLCGHTHGGQIWPFGYLVKYYYPYLYGRYDLPGMTAIVSRGAGTWGPRMRLWQAGEILKITLHSND